VHRFGTTVRDGGMPAAVMTKPEALPRCRKLIGSSHFEAANRVLLIACGEKRTCRIIIVYFSVSGVIVSANYRRRGACATQSHGLRVESRK
jgi:hypothetical protein